jgi:uncharacterized protein YdiU (UPF0061 family)
MFREFGGPEPAPPNSPDRADFNSRAIELLRHSSRRIANLTAEWIRVGFCQGNFNSDNCLVGGRTMDYGPFGFMEKYARSWNMWKDSGDHFSFRNQPVAGGRNFYSLAKSVALLLNDADDKDEVQRILSSHEIIAQEAVNNIYRQKLGLKNWTEQAADVFQRIDDLMEESEVDYTLFWRQLATIPETLLKSETSSAPDTWSDDALFASLKDVVFYKPLSAELEAAWKSMLRRWLGLVSAEVMAAVIAASDENNEEKKVEVGEEDRALSVSRRAAKVSAEMRRVSPKYVPREWMLVEAYKAAEQKDFSAVLKLQQVFKSPYDELPQFESAYYRRMPDEMERNGVTCMT